MIYEGLAKQIIELRRKDLELRDALIAKGTLWEGYHPEMRRLHNRNAETLDKIIQEIGYPTIEKVGKEAANAAWLVIQHSIDKPDFMRKCLEQLSAAVDNKQVSPIQRAYLADRIAILEGKPQKYGTQFDWDMLGNMSPQPFDDLIKVNQRRRRLGLNTLEVQTEIMRTKAKKENETPPADYNKRRKEMDQWRKNVGWID